MNKAWSLLYCYAHHALFTQKIDLDKCQNGSSSYWTKAAVFKTISAKSCTWRISICRSTVVDKGSSHSATIWKSRKWFQIVNSRISMGSFETKEQNLSNLIQLHSIASGWILLGLCRCDKGSWKYFPVKHLAEKWFQMCITINQHIKYLFYGIPV